MIVSAEFFIAIADTISEEKTGGEFAKKTFYNCSKNFTYQVMLFDSSAMIQPSLCLGSAQAEISEFLEPLIPSIMRIGDKTNLFVEQSSKESRMIEFSFTTHQYYYSFLTKSTSRFDIYMDKVEELQEGIIVNNLHVTRWIACAESVKVVWNSYEVLLCMLEELNGMVTTEIVR